MSKAGKLVKGLVKTKKESVMGKLGDSPFEDPMDQWSVKYNAPVRNEETEQLDEDGWLFKYIRSLGYNPEVMPFATRAKYARTRAFKHYKQSHAQDGSKTDGIVTKEEVEQISELDYKTLQSYRQKAHTDVQHHKFGAGKDKPDSAKTISKREAGQEKATKRVIDIHKKNAAPIKAVKQEPYKPLGGRDEKSGRSYSEGVEHLEEAGTGLLMQFIKAKGLNPLTMDGNQKHAYARSSEFKIFKMKHQKEEFDRLVDLYGRDNLLDVVMHIQETSGMGERGEDWDEVTGNEVPKQVKEKKKIKEATDKEDVISLNIPLLIRILEYAREDAKTDMDLHKVVENLISMRDKGILSMHEYDQIVKITEGFEKLDEISKELANRYMHSAFTDRRKIDDKMIDLQNKQSSGDKFFRSHKKIGKLLAKSDRRTTGISRALNRVTKEDVALEEAFKVGDLVRPNAGPHKGATHEVIHVHDDGSVNIKPHKMPTKMIKYSLGAAKAQPHQLERVNEEVEQIDELSKKTLGSYIKHASDDRSWRSGSAAAAREQGKDKASERHHALSFKRAKGIYKAADRLAKEDVEQIDELKSSTYDSYINKVTDPKVASTRGKTPSGTLKSIKAISGVARAIGKKAKAELKELKKMPDNMDADDHLTREDLRQWFSKSHPEGDWKRINSKGEVAGPCAREPGEPKPKCMSKEKRAKLSKSERAAAVAAKRKHDPVADRPGKGGKPINVSNFGKGKLSEDSEQLDEKNSPTNPKLWSRAKAMARSKFDVYPSAYANGWASKWYKSKGGGWKSVKEDVVQEGIGGIEDSPLSATNSVKAMESAHRKGQMKSARMIKSLYKKKIKENLYDWEKDDKPKAKIVVQGGTTMTGQPRDTVEIEPVLKSRPNSAKPTN